MRTLSTQLFIFLCFFSTQIFASDISIYNNVTYTVPDCENPISFQSTDQGFKTFNISYTYQGDPGSEINALDRIWRKAIFKISDENGDLIKSIDKGWTRATSENINFTTDDMEGLTTGYYTVDLKLEYSFSGDSPNPVFMHVQNNGVLECVRNLDNLNGSLFKCTLNNVDCFDYFKCMDVNLSISYFQNKLRIDITDGSGNYEIYIYADPKTGPGVDYWNKTRLRFLCGEWTYFVTVTDLETGCQSGGALYFNRICDTAPENEDEIGLVLNGGDNTEEPQIEQQFNRSDIQSVKEGSIDFTNSIHAFPNPVSETLNIEVENVEQQIQSIQVMGSSGKLIYQSVIKADLFFHQIDMSELNDGLYLIQATTQSGEHFYEKVIKQ